MPEPNPRFWALLLVGFAAGWLALCGQEPAARDPIKQLVNGAIEQVGKTIYYDGSYRRIPYPGGDLPIERGVCTDVIVRAFRNAGIDLQALVHEDMRSHFAQYPQLWGLPRPDSNIDHRRVPNLKAFFRRKNKAVAISRDGRDYPAGDIVTWRLSSGVPHIGLVSDRPAPSKDRLLVVHNIGRGAQLEDVLFEYEITGHFRYF